MSKKVMVIIRHLHTAHNHPVAHAVVEQLDIKDTNLTQEEYTNYLPEWFEEQAEKIISDFRKKFPEFEKASFLRYILKESFAGTYLQFNHTD